MWVTAVQPRFACWTCLAVTVGQHSGLKVQSAQLMPNEAAQKLKADVSNTNTEVLIMAPIANRDPDLQPLPAASTQAAAAKTEQAVSAVAGTAQTEQKSAVTHAEALIGPSVVTSEPVAVQSSRSVTAAISAAAPIPVAHSLPSYQALKPGLKPANLVIGDLTPLHCQPGQQAASSGGSAPKGNLEGQTGGANGQGLPFKGDCDEALGVMEAEYSRGYRTRLLWECAMALSCLQPGERTLALVTLTHLHVCTQALMPTPNIVAASFYKRSSCLGSIELPLQCTCTVFTCIDVRQLLILISWQLLSHLFGC